MEGVRGLFRGSGIPFLSWAIFYNFGLTEPLFNFIQRHEWTGKPIKDADLYIGKLLAASFMYLVVGHPLAVARTNIAYEIGPTSTRVNQGLVGTLKNVVRKEGFKGLYSGVLYSAVPLLIPNYCLYISSLFYKDHKLSWESYSQYYSEPEYFEIY